MEILCPLCQNKLAIPDQYAGQLVKCPTCAGMFQAPTLPGTPTMSPPPPPASPPPRPAPSAPVDAPPPEAPQEQAPQPSTPLPPLPDGFNHIYFLTFKLEIISWIAVACLGLIFIFSFFTWTTVTKAADYKKELLDVEDKDSPYTPSKFTKATITPQSMWNSSVVFIFYIIFYFFTLIFAVLAILLDKKVFSLPEPLKKLRRYRSLFVAGFGFMSLFALLLHWASTINFSEPNPNTAVFSIVLFLQLLVVVAPLLEYWLQQRKKDDLPPPRLALHW